MSTGNIFRLLLLAAIWGSAFLCLRIAVPAIGALQVTELRILIAGLGMLAYAKFTGIACEWRRLWPHYLLIGAINSALPFSLFAYGAKHLPSSYEVILNSSSPLFAAAFSAMWLSERLTAPKVAGLIVGAIGVAFVAGISPPGTDLEFGMSVIACLTGAACYGLAGVYIRKFTPDIKPAAMAGCSQIMAAVLMAPALAGLPAAEAFTPAVIAALFTLSLLCSGVAYLLYLRLLADAGPSQALSVTFLMPVFGMIWGALLLQETITPGMIGGCALIVAGTASVLGFVGKKDACAAQA
ncbi:MAG: DMT family transporter [Alphaproteobacteria bacterium]|nr:MAG: DMT family transporter [Alphaproteobacteria bacterium]